MPLTTNERTEIVTGLIANGCGCWKEEDRETLNAFADEKLSALKDAAEEHAERDALIEALFEGIDTGNGTIQLLEDGNWAVTNAEVIVPASFSGDDEILELVENCGGEGSGVPGPCPTGGTKKNRGRKTKVVKGYSAKSAAPHAAAQKMATALKDKGGYVSEPKAVPGGWKITHRPKTGPTQTFLFKDSNPKSLSGQRGETYNSEGETMATNESPAPAPVKAVQPVKAPTLKEYLDGAPTEVRRLIENSMKIVDDSKRKVVAGLTANLKGDAKAAMATKLMAKELDDLNDLVLIANSAPAPASQVQPTYLGAAGGPVENAAEDTFDRNDVIPRPTINWAAEYGSGAGNGVPAKKTPVAA